MTQSTSSAGKTSPDQSTSRYPWLLILIFRVLLLAVGGGIALIAGIVFANFYPNPNPEKPLLIKVLEGFDKPTPTTSPNASPTFKSQASNPPSLTSVQKQAVAAQLTQLQGQLRGISNSVAALETQLGSTHAQEPIEVRLQALSLELEGSSAPSSNALSSENNSTNQVATVSAPPSQTNKLKATLPSDILFEQSNSILRPEANLILDKVIALLRNYPSSTIRVAAHTDASYQTEDDQELAFRRAKAVEQYLVRSLGNQFRWLVIGYGSAHPVSANNTNTNQQRDRCVEIAVN